IDRSGNVVSVLRGTFMEPVMRDYLQQANLLVVDSFHAREQEVLSGRADVFMTDYPYGKRVEEAEGWGVMLAPEKPLAQTYYAYAIAKGQPNWLATVNQFVRQQQANGALQKLAKKYRLEKIVAK
ncbi:MAG: substrate-binding periplasmic protein, partial [Pontibacterium sp.]